MFFVVEGLVFLAVIALVGPAGVPVQGLRAVLADANGRFGILGVEFIQPGAGHARLAAVPAEVQVVADHVGDAHDGVVDGAHGHAGHDGGPGGVHLMGHIIQDMVILQHVVVGGGHHGDFVG